MKALKFPTADDEPPAAAIPAGIKLDHLKLYSGANRYHGSTVLTCELDFGTMAGIKTGQLGAEFGGAFLERFQSLPSFLPNNGISDSFASALRSGSDIDLVEVMLEAILAVEHTVSFAQHDLRCLDFAAIDRDGESPILIWETTRSKTSRLSAEVALAAAEVDARRQSLV